MNAKADEEKWLRRQLVVSRRVLLMVHELHALGFQRLRVCPALSPSGAAWRCFVTPVSNTLRSHGARISDWSLLAAHYTSGDEDRYFGWPDGPGKGAKALARMFLDRFPEIAAEGYGADWEYAGWFSWMLSLTDPDALPYAVADWETPDEFIPTVPGGLVVIPLPPPGAAEDEVTLE